MNTHIKKHTGSLKLPSTNKSYVTTGPGSKEVKEVLENARLFIEKINTLS
jgi:hypothetical protein